LIILIIIIIIIIVIIIMITKIIIIWLYSYGPQVSSQAYMCQKLHAHAYTPVHF
jgi:hypothetical protein